MKVKELIKLLEKEDPEREVVLSKDIEGNGYSPLSEHELGTYVATTTMYGDFHQGFDPMTKEDGIKAVALFPIN